MNQKSDKLQLYPDFDITIPSEKIWRKLGVPEMEKIIANTRYTERKFENKRNH